MPKEQSQESKSILDKLVKLKIGQTLTIKKDYLRIQKKIGNIIFQSQNGGYEKIQDMNFSLSIKGGFLTVTRMA